MCLKNIDISETNKMKNKNITLSEQSLNLVGTS